MLEYSKLILQKMSFDMNLFAKELRKFLKALQTPEEVDALKHWVYQHYYSDEYQYLLEECFYKQS